MGGKWTYLMAFMVVATAVLVVYATQKEFNIPAPADEGNEASPAYAVSADAPAGSPEFYAKGPPFPAETEEAVQYLTPGVEGESSNALAVPERSTAAADRIPPTKEELLETARQRARQRAVEMGRLREFEAAEAMRRAGEKTWNEIRKLDGEERIKAIRALRMERKRQRAIERGRLREFEEWEARRREREAQREKRKLERERMRSEDLEEEEEESQLPAY